MVGEAKSVHDGGEVEVLARVCRQHILGWGVANYLYVPVGTELVDRAHVTRLQAEVERLKEVYKSYSSKLVVDALNSDNKALQSELTKARELFEHMLKDDDMPVYWFAQRIDEFLSKQ